MDIVVFGGSGQVGSELIKLLKMHDFSFIAPTSNEVSFLDCNDINNFLNGCSPQIIINCAAYTDVEAAESKSDDAFKVNFYAVQTIANFCLNNSVPLIHISTDYVFNGRKDSEYIETDEVSPLNIYGWSKLAGEKAITDILKEYVIFRTSWVFSATGKNFVTTMTSLLNEKNEVMVVGDQYGCPTSASSIASAIIFVVMAIKSNSVFRWGIYNYSNHPPTTWFDVSKKILEILSKNNKSISCEIIKVSSDKFPTKAKRPAFSVLSNKKFTKETSIPPYLWEDEIAKILLN